MPAIQDTVGEAHVFQRTPCWAPPRLDGYFTTKESWVLRNIPWASWFYRIYTYLFYETGMYIFVTLGDRAEKTKKIIARYHSRKVKNQELAKKLTPTYMPGCKRMTPSDHYLKTFNEKHVHLHTESIEEIDEDGIILNNGEKIKQY